MTEAGRTKECPSCAMDVPVDARECPICGFEYPTQRVWITVLAVLLILIFVFFWII